MTMETTSSTDAYLKKEALPPLPQVQTVMLVNNFIANTMEFANLFASSCEEKLTTVSRRLSDVELALALFEAKLNSVPDNAAIKAPEEKRIDAEEKRIEAEEKRIEASDAAPPREEEIMSVARPPPPPREEEEEEVSEAEEVNKTTIPVREHPSYAPFFRLQRLGVPEPQIQLKMQAEGVDPELLQDPEKLIERPPPSDSDDDDF